MSDARQFLNITTNILCCCVCFQYFWAGAENYLDQIASIIGTYNRGERWFFEAVRLRGEFSMLKSFRAPPAGIASLGAILVVALIGGTAAFLSGVLEVKAAPQTNAAVHQSKKGDRLVIPRGAACSALGWPHYEQSCQFDMRRPADDRRIIRVIALR
jgi:hypothetical protein